MKAATKLVVKKLRGLSPRPSDRSLSAKLVPTFADIGCHVVSVTDPYGHIFGFLDRSRYSFFQVAPHLYSRGWVDPVPDPLLLRKSDSAGNRARNLWICSQELWSLDHRGGSTNLIYSPYFKLCAYLNFLNIGIHQTSWNPSSQISLVSATRRNPARNRHWTQP
jgi:hypothetical protein